MQPAADFDGLSAAAYSRSEADWLIGINATRGITKRLKGRREKGVWSAGRVQTPTLAILVHRELKVLAHVPVPFWRLLGTFSANGHEYTAQYRRSKSAKDGEKIWQEKDAVKKERHAVEKDAKKNGKYKQKASWQQGNLIMLLVFHHKRLKSYDCLHLF